MRTIFSKIVDGEIPSYKIFETENTLAFLDISPISKGHTLVIPKKEMDHWESLDSNIFTEMNITAQIIGKALKVAYPAERIGLVIAGFEVPHTHIHVFSANSLADYDFKNTLNFTPEEFSKIALKLKNNINLPD